MDLANNMGRVAIAVVLSAAAPFAMAYDDCVKPKVKGYSADEMSCMGEGLVSI